MRISDWSSYVCSADLTNLDIWHSEDEPRLGAVLGECWHLLCDGAADPQHDFHLAALATQHAGFGCALRTVVLRKVDSEARELWFYTDLRSRKIGRSEEHTSELQSLMRISYAVFCLKKKT